MPYRIDLRHADDTMLDRLVELEALDVEATDTGVAALLPDRVTPERAARVLGVGTLAVSPAVSRDDGSVWILTPRATHVGGLQIVPAGTAAGPGALTLTDTAAFGTGLHATTALCLELLAEIVTTDRPERVLDVGTGSGVLALAALKLGVPRATAIDIDPAALRAAADNARLNGLDARIDLVFGGPDAVEGAWPLVLANVVAAPLIEMAPVLVRRAGHHASLVLSGIPEGVNRQVAAAYCRLGMREVTVRSRSGWVAVVLRASW